MLKMQELENGSFAVERSHSDSIKLMLAFERDLV